MIVSSLTQNILEYRPSAEKNISWIQNLHFSNMIRKSIQFQEGSWLELSYDVSIDFHVNLQRPAGNWPYYLAYCWALPPRSRSQSTNQGIKLFSSYILYYNLNTSNFHVIKNHVQPEEPKPFEAHCALDHSMLNNKGSENYKQMKNWARHVAISCFVSLPKRRAQKNNEEKRKFNKPNNFLCTRA